MRVKILTKEEVWAYHAPMLEEVKKNRRRLGALFNDEPLNIKRKKR